MMIKGTSIVHKVKILGVSTKKISYLVDYRIIKQRLIFLKLREILFNLYFLTQVSEMMTS